MKMAKLTKKMIEAGAEVLFGSSKEKAIEWVKLDKFESCEHRAEEIFKAMIAAMDDDESALAKEQRDGLAKPRVISNGSAY
jgi:hypothetical protein